MSDKPCPLCKTSFVKRLPEILGSIVFAAVVLLFVNFAGDILVAPKTAPVPIQSVKAVPETAPAKPAAEAAMDAAADAATTAPDAAPVVAALSDQAADGKKLFRKKCMSCHTVDQGGRNSTGPNLWGVVGRDKGAVEDFRYSAQLLAKGGTWTAEDIESFIASPRSFINNTKMTFAGLKDPEDRAIILAYLMTLAE